MFGARGLWNFGWRETVEEGEGERDGGRGEEGGMRIDEEEMMDGGLRGRFSAGGEVYFSARQRSFGSVSIYPLFPHALPVWVPCSHSLTG